VHIKIRWEKLKERDHLEDSDVDGRITPLSRVLPEKLTIPQLVKKFSAFYET
jgi:hypothetical protein